MLLVTLITIFLQGAYLNFGIDPRELFCNRSQKAQPEMKPMESHAEGSQPAEFAAYLENQLKIARNPYSTMNWA